MGFFSAFTLESEKDRLLGIEDKMQKELSIARKDLKDDIDKARKELTSEIKASFERGNKLPDVVILGDIERPLEGQTLKVKTEPPTEKGAKIRVSIPIILKNQGKGASEPIFAKIYFSKDLATGSESTDEKEFAYETYYHPGKWPFQPAILPAGVSTSLRANFNVRHYNEKADKFPVLIKVYFGGASSNQAKFYIKLP